MHNCKNIECNKNIAFLIKLRAEHWSTLVTKND